MHRPLWIILGVLFSTTATLPGSEPQPLTLHLPVERYLLANGLTVILHPDHRRPNVVVDMLFKVGSKDEARGKSGFAHLFEHLMFMGTRNVPNGAFDSIMEAEGGTNNAWTNEDFTNYYELGPAPLLETFLWLEADRLSSLPDDMTAGKVDLQRDVVKNERRQSYENRPYGKVDLVLPEQLYPESHPYQHPVIGSHVDLDAAKVDDVKAFFRQFYVPSNATLVISGDFQPADARRLVDKYFAWMKKAPVPPHAAPKPVGLDKQKRVTLDDAVQLPRVVLAWHSPAAFHDGDAAADLLAAYLGHGKSSALHQALVYRRKLAESVEVEQESARYGGHLVVTATARSGHSAAELEAALLEELAHAAPSEDDLRRARATVQTELLRQLESPVHLAQTLAFVDVYFRGQRDFERRFLGRFDEIDLAALHKWQRQIFGAPHVMIAVAPARSGS